MIVLLRLKSRWTATDFRARPRDEGPTPSSAWGLQWRSNRHAPRNTRGRNVRSKIRWFTEFCNSHYLSHFAAFFIDARTKRSVVESFSYWIGTQTTLMNRVSEWPSAGARRARGGPRAGVGKTRGPPKQQSRYARGEEAGPKPPRHEAPLSLMILPQVHLRKPCYDFYFL